MNRRILRYSDDSNYPKEPVRIFLLISFIFGALSVTATPFVHQVETSTFLFSAIALSVFLGFFVVGLALCPFKLAKWGLLVVIFLVFFELLSISLVVLIKPLSQTALIAVSAGGWGLLVSVLINAGFAAYGWVRFLRQGISRPQPNIERTEDETSGHDTELSIKRASQITFRMTTFWVLLDGREIGGIKNGQTGTFKIAPGEHSIQLHAGCWYRTEKLRFSVEANQTVRFECGSNVKGWKVLLSPFLLFSPEVWVFIERVE